MLHVFSLSGSPPLRYHFQHYKGAEFQNGPSVVSRPLQYIARNGNTFSNNRLHWARPAYPVQYQRAYGGAYRSYPCQNLLLQRLRYRPCQYQAYPRQQRTFSRMYQNPALVGQYQPQRQTYAVKTEMPEVGARYVQDHQGRSTLVPNKYFLNQDGVWEPHDVYGSSVIDTNFIRPQPPLPEVKEGEVGRDEKEKDGGRVVEEREREE